MPLCLRHAIEKHYGRFSGLPVSYATIKPCPTRSRKTLQSYTRFSPAH
jgi:hypothetical protein